MTELRYTEEQFAEILRRATEMQSALPARSGAAASDASTGLSLTEIRTIAGEVGIDPEYVTRAAAMIGPDAQPDRARGDRWVLSSSSAGSLSDSDRIRVVRAIRDAAEAHGIADTGGSGVEWRDGSGDATRLHVSVEPLDGRNEVRVSVNANAPAILSHVFPMLATGLIGTGIGANMEFGLIAGLATVAASGATGLTIGQLIWRRIRRGLMQRSRRILAAVTAVLPPPDEASG